MGGSSLYGEPGSNISARVNNIDVPAKLRLINSNPDLPLITEAITQGIADNFDPAGTAPSVGVGVSQVTPIIQGIVTVVNNCGKVAIGGTVIGLEGNLIIQNNQADAYEANQDGAFEFTIKIAVNGNISSMLERLTVLWRKASMAEPNGCS